MAKNLPRHTRLPKENFPQKSNLRMQYENPVFANVEWNPMSDVEVILAGGTAVVAFGSTTAEEFTAQFRPSVLTVAR